MLENCEHILFDPKNVSTQFLLAELIDIHPYSRPLLLLSLFLDSSSLDSLLLLASQPCQVSTPYCKVGDTSKCVPLTSGFQAPDNGHSAQSQQALANSLNHWVLHSNHIYSAHEAISNSEFCLCCFFLWEGTSPSPHIFGFSLV